MWYLRKRKKRLKETDYIMYYNQRMSMFIKRPTKNVDNVNEDVRVYLYVPIEYKEQAKELGAQWEKPKLKWFSYKSNPNLQKLVDIFYQDNFRTDFYGEHMKAVTKTEQERIEDDVKKAPNIKIF